MKTIFNYAAWLLFVIVFALTGCSDDKGEPAPETPEPSIEFGSETDLKPVVSVEGGTSTLTFTASDDWTASVSAVTRAIDWLSVSPTQGGAGTVTLQITTQPNDTYDERNAAIVLSCGNVQKTVTLTQKQKDALLVTSNKVEMEAIGGTFGIELQANVDVSYEIEEAAREWLTVASSSTRGLTTSTLNFQASENTDTETRQAVITLRGGELTEKVTVYQAGSDPSILLSQKEYTVASDGETIQVELKSNVSYEVVMPEVQWITESSTRAVSSYTHYFVISPNDTYDARSAEISFINKENNIEEKVVITQVQKDAIIVAQNEYEIPAAGGSLDFTLQANVDVEVTVSVGWIVQQDASTRGLTEQKLCFDVMANEDTENDREGTITLKGKESDITQVIIVKQLKKVPIVIEGDQATLEMGTDADAVKQAIIDAAAQGVKNFILKGDYEALRLTTDNPFEGISVNMLDLSGVTNWPVADGLAEIPDKAFYKYANIQEVILSEEVQVIGDNAFAQCSGLKRIEASGVQKVNYAAFQSCSHLEEVVMPEVVSMGRVSFSFTGLKKVYFPKLTTLEGNVFWFCSSLTEVNLPEAVKIGDANDGTESPRYGSSVFADCSNLQKVSLPKAVEIGERAFGGCTMLQEIDLPMAETLGVSTFMGCKAVTTIRLPKVKTIKGDNNFTNCPLLTDLYLTSPDDISINSNCFGSSSFSKQVNLYLNANKKDEMEESVFGIEWRNYIWKDIIFIE